MVKIVALIGSGAVAKCYAKKVAQLSGLIDKLIIVSRNERTGRQVVSEMSTNHMAIELMICNVEDDSALASLLRTREVDLVVNAGSTYCNEPVLKACLASDTHYIDASCAERPGENNVPAPWYDNIEATYSAQFREKGLTALLSIGFDPGVVNVFSAYASKMYFDDLHSIDILDVNDGTHGKYFATNFDPDVNLREIAEDVIYWEGDEYKTIPSLSQSIEFNFPVIGNRRLFAVGHDEVHSLPQNLKAKTVRFWMGFSDHYIHVFTVLNKLGLLSNSVIQVDDQLVSPIRVIKSLLPEPASLAKDYSGKACIGVFMRGVTDGKPQARFIYSTFDHEETYAEIGEQAVSYSTAIPLVTATELFFRGDWNPKQMVHVELLDPEPFLELLPKHGIDWQCIPWDEGNFKAMSTDPLVAYG